MKQQLLPVPSSIAKGQPCEPRGTQPAGDKPPRATARPWGGVRGCRPSAEVHVALELGLSWPRGWGRVAHGQHSLLGQGTAPHFSPAPSASGLELKKKIARAKTNEEEEEVGTRASREACA